MHHVLIVVVFCLIDAVTMSLAVEFNFSRAAITCVGWQMILWYQRLHTCSRGRGSYTTRQRLSGLASMRLHKTHFKWSILQ